MQDKLDIAFLITSWKPGKEDKIFSSEEIWHNRPAQKQNGLYQIKKYV